MIDPLGKFETERTRRFRTRELNANDERSIDTIETFECEVIQVKGSNTGPGWS